MTARETTDRIVELAQEKKGKQITRMDISDLSGFADFFVIITGDSEVQIKALCDHIENELRLEGIRPYSKEGTDSHRWVVLDYIEVVIHIFNNETRQFYGIERLWADAETELISEE